jgi:hypothetical protein
MQICRLKAAAIRLHLGNFVLMLAYLHGARAGAAGLAMPCQIGHHRGHGNV